MMDVSGITSFRQMEPGMRFKFTSGIMRAARRTVLRHYPRLLLIMRVESVNRPN